MAADKHTPMCAAPHRTGGAHLFDPHTSRYLSVSPGRGEIAVFVSDGGGKNVAVSMNPEDAIAYAEALQSAAQWAMHRNLEHSKEAA